MHLQDDKGPMEFAEHYHDFYEICFHYAGEVEYKVEGRVYRLQPSDILIVNKQNTHYVYSSGKYFDRLMLMLSPSFIESISTEKTNLKECFDSIENRRRKNLLRLNPFNHAKIWNTLFKIENVLKNDAYGVDILLRNYICELLVQLNRYAAESYMESIDIDSGNSKMVEATVTYINNNLATDLSLDNICKNLFVSKYHLSREFKKCVGYTIHQYILIKRLLMAESLLHDGTLSVSEICHSCGFEDYTNFIRTFTKHYGVSPGKFSKYGLLLKEDYVNDLEMGFTSL